VDHTTCKHSGLISALRSAGQRLPGMDNCGTPMAVKPILQMGDARLLNIAEPVADFNARVLHALVEDLIDTMRTAEGVGLAAPQIGVGLRIVVFGFDRSPRYPDAEPIPQTVLINPMIKPLSDDQNEAWEGCLSVPGLRGMVPRWTHIRYTGFDLLGTPIERHACDFHARVVQHECDHLDGILYPQRMTDMSRFGFIKELEASGALTRLPCDTLPT
jgi:peptide deformylase